jgi:class 3 adenylate cyclase
MQQTADWLQKLGLGQYAQRFAENDISFAILPDLTDQDLKELGVASLGHRRQLLRAITELKGGETGTPKATSEHIAPVTPHDTAERRQVTVMFSDLVGSTALSARMDPEDLRELISAYQKCVADTVQRFGGFVAKRTACASLRLVHRRLRHARFEGGEGAAGRAVRLTSSSP